MRQIWVCARLASMTFALILGGAANAGAQATVPTPETCMPRNLLAPAPTYRSVEPLADGRVTFRFCAPGASTVMMTTGDMPDLFPFMMLSDLPPGMALTKDAKGLWSGTTDKPVAADTYRYGFRVDGVQVPDPRAVTSVRERSGVSSTFEMPGPAGAFQSFNKDVPHGSVTEINYWSGSLGAVRRAMIYTPPGYMNGAAKYPVLYLVHGAGDSDDSWTATGHAHYILDNLIAAGKATPMIVVMPFGHTPDRPVADPTAALINNDEFGNDLLQDLMPFVERNFRTINAPDSRAMAGLSMGGAHTLRFGLTHPELFHHIGIFSMGLGLRDPAEVAQYQSANGVALKRGAGQFKLVYYAIGKADFLYGTVAATRATLDKYGITYVYNESEGGHTWINWRRYLEDFAPRLFK
jgi:enterochelin esterase-like enzyme